MKSSNDKISGAGAGAGAGAIRRKASKAAAGVQPATVQPATVNPFAMVVWAGSCIWGRSSVERAQALRRFRVGRVLWRQAQAAAKAQAAAGAAVLAAWQASRVAYWASVATVQPATVQPATVQPATASGGGGLVSMAAGLAAFNPARRASAVECQSIGALLRGCERPAGPILGAIQLAGDLAIVRSLAHKLNRKMVGDGRESCFKRDDSSGAEFGAFDWVMSMREACNDATAKLIMYRAGYGLTRDESSGGDVLTVGDELGNACGVWLKGFGKGFKGAFIPSADKTGQALAGYKFMSSSARIVWRALSDSIKDDNMGESEATQAAAADFYAWAAMSGDWGQLVSGVTIEQRDTRRLAVMDQIFEQMAAGRGKVKAFAAKAKQATVLILSGMAGEQALMAAGFKASKGSGGSGAMSACNIFAGALRRKGFNVVSKRGNFAQDSIEVDEVKTAHKRGGAARDLASLHSFPAVSRECPAVQQAPIWAGHVCGRSCIMAAVVRSAFRSGASLMRGVGRKRDFGGLRFAWSQLPASARFRALSSGQRAGLALRAAGVIGSVQRRGLLVPAVQPATVQPATVQPATVQLATVQPLPLLPAQVRRIVAAFNRRKLRGVLRSVK